MKESTLRKLRHHNFLRTNQFKVYSELDGLEERFRVLNRDGLGDALRERLDALGEIADKWTPDILHFLLELSDQPVQNSKLRDLELLKAPDEEPEPPLKWDDIAKEEGWDRDRDLWKDVDFADDSSDGEYVEDAKSDVSAGSEDTSPSSVEARYRPQPTDYLAAAPDYAGLEAVQETRAWRHEAQRKDVAVAKSRKIFVSELHILREIIFMLRGLRNTLLDQRALRYVQLSHASEEVYFNLLGSLGEAGVKISILRTFAGKAQNVPLMQVFQDAIGKRLLIFDNELSNIEAQFVDIKQDLIVSLVKLLDAIKLPSQPLLSLSTIVQELTQAKYPHPFHYLELLFNAADVAHMEGDEATYECLGAVFFECFQVYVRPIRLWMETGELIEGDKTFFISRSSTQTHLSQIWKRQFKLRKTTSGTLHAPRFLHPATNKIFTTGKSIVVLKHMGRHTLPRRPAEEPSLDFEDARSLVPGDLTPFTEIFNTAFERWMQSKHHAASSTLRQALVESYGLWSVLDDLQHIYLMCNGAQADVFASSVFGNIDLLNPIWHDRFSLTEVAREAYHTAVDVHRIAVSVADEHRYTEAHEIRRTVRKGLPGITISYRLPWPIQIVLTDESLDHYKSVFTLLLQLRRASYVLRKYRLMADGAGEMSHEQSVFYRLRARLLWFCGALQSYLSTLVIEPLTAGMRAELRRADDIDDLAAAHSAYAKRMVDEACLGSKLDPIRQCALDVLDLATRLEDARQAEAARTEERKEISRLSMAPVTASPLRQKQQQRGGAAAAVARYVQASEEEDETFLAEQDTTMLLQEDADRSYAELLAEIGADFDRLLKFMCGGLRGVARASSNVAAVKWDTLAEMLEVGIQQDRQGFNTQSYI